MNRYSRLERTTPLVQRPTCCGKKTWATEVLALAALDRIQRITQGKEGPQRVYRCKAGNYHLTSKNKRAATETEWQRMVREVFGRDGWRCVICGSNYQIDPHHRVLKGVGGPDIPQNLVTLCRVHHDWVHLNRRDAEKGGYIVPSHIDPANVEVAYRERGPVYLTAEYGYDEIPSLGGVA